MNLHEDIHRIKEVMGISQPKELTPVITNRFVYHNSNPFFRDQIKEMGLIVKGKSETWLSDTPIEGDVIFATNSDEKSDWFDSTYDDDIYRIDTTKINNEWYEDPNFSGSKHIITFNNIPKKAIKLIYKGTGNDLQENVDRDKRPNKIMKMIDDIGLYNTVKMVGGYESLLNYINPEDISESDKIKFIRDAVTSKGPEISGRNNISIFDLKIPPIRYDSYGNTERMITTFYRDGVKLNVYKDGKFSTSQLTSYDRISEDVLNKILNLMINLLDDKKEEMSEGELTERCWKGYTQKGMKTMFGKKYPNCVKVKK
jgi:hypothetical protein